MPHRHRSNLQNTFVIEALIILMCLLMLVAVVLMVFSVANNSSLHTSRVQHAMVMAQNAAERFAANPAATTPVSEGGYSLEFKVRDGAQQVRYATITVTFEGEELYALDTARFVPSADEAKGA